MPRGKHSKDPAVIQKYADRRARRTARNAGVQKPLEAAAKPSPDELKAEWDKMCELGHRVEAVHSFFLNIGTARVGTLRHEHRIIGIRIDEKTYEVWAESSFVKRLGDAPNKISGVPVRENALIHKKTDNGGSNVCSEIGSMILSDPRISLDPA